MHRIIIMILVLNSQQIPCSERLSFCRPPSLLPKTEKKKTTTNFEIEDYNFIQ